MTSALGIDIGGTKIAVGLVSESGAVLARAQTATPARSGPTAILDETIRLSQTIMGANEIAAIGVGAAGVIDPRTGTVISATAILSDWAGTDVAGQLQDAFGVEVTVTNDAHAHAAGEAAFGAGAAHETVLLIAVGTGIGGAIVVNNVPLAGAHGAAGHIGHVPTFQAEDLECSCGRFGHVEAISSGPGLLNLYKRLGGNADATDARDVLQRAEYETTARTAVEVSAHALGVAIGGLVNVADPDVVVIAGGLQESGDRWWRQLRNGLATSVLPSLAEVPLVPAALGQDAAVIGAAVLALKAKERQC